MSKRNLRKRIYSVFLACATTAIALPAQTFATLHSFDSTDGANPYAGLVQATDGALYGTTSFGGVNSSGAIFRITPSGTLTTLHSFCSQSGCSDGQFPYGALVQAANGNFYGTTYYGGANQAGAVFKITPSGTPSTLYSFCAQGVYPDCMDGYNPGAGLVQATNGNFYGTTELGGANGGEGTIFKITPGGALTTLYSFCAHAACLDGAIPSAAMIQATDGNLYGTTPLGGANLIYGTVFKITLSGTLTTLHSFDITDGSGPAGALVQATNGDFYGTTSHGGTNGDYGTVFRITPSGTLTTLYSFCSEIQCADGEQPLGGLVQATNGDFYGTTSGGGANSGGTIFKVTPSGTLTRLYSFCSERGCTDGKYPAAGLIQATNGKFYGTTQLGGAGLGTVFSLSVGLVPFVEIQPTSGKVGATVKILGTNLTGATSVSFNGMQAVFTVIAGSLITATVPAGATTGEVEVVTPNRTLTSNVPFRVRP